MRRQFGNAGPLFGGQPAGPCFATQTAERDGCRVFRGLELLPRRLLDDLTGQQIDVGRSFRSLVHAPILTAKHSQSNLNSTKCQILVDRFLYDGLNAITNCFLRVCERFQTDPLPQIGVSSALALAPGPFWSSGGRFFGHFRGAKKRKSHFCRITYVR